jgi:hypothetical protein
MQHTHLHTAEALHRRPLTAEASVWLQASRWRIYGGKTSTREHFSSSNSIFAFNIIPQMHHSHISFLYYRHHIIWASESVVTQYLPLVRLAHLKGVDQLKEQRVHFITISYKLTGAKSSLRSYTVTQPQLMNNFPAFYGIQTFIRCLQNLASCPYPKPDDSSSYLPTPYP